MRTLWKMILAASGVSSMACGGDEPPRIRSLIDHRAFAVAEGEADPFRAFRPIREACDPEAYGFEMFSEEPSYTVRTAGCAYLTVVQPARVSTEPDEQIRIRLWHYNLVNVDGASEALVAVAIGGEPLWQARIPIPSRGALRVETVALSHGFPEGASVAFHVQNHGINTWNLLEISAGIFDADDGGQQL